ncbi:conjugative transposon protein TraM [Flagellimonas marina]|uniref:Conjugative transposon protein TraM n=1 Tax=Flagellimonas marina TaxID=1775168 RepID=A0ABV8PJ67_9FLAO
MKTQKSKIVFVLVMVCIVLFIAVYALITFGKDKEIELKPDRIPMPDLDGKTVEYESKMEALDAIKEEREVTAPQLYPDHMVDDKGYFNPDYMEYEKHRIIDSVYQSKRFVEKAPHLKIRETTASTRMLDSMEAKDVGEPETQLSTQELMLKHQLFFASKPLISKVNGLEDNDAIGDNIGLLAYVDGKQTLREGHRLVMRLEGSVQIDGRNILRGTRVYGFVKLRPNRMMVEVDRIEDQKLKLQVHDLQDGQAGIYMENHLKGEMIQASVDETLSEVNLPGFPQFRGIKRIFQRDRRAVRVEVADKYQIILKQEL